MLNKSTGNMYDFVTHTWNPIKGKCFHDCSYCYMKRFGEQKLIHLDEKELDTNLGENNFIFVGSSCDIFAQDIPNSWINIVLQKCKDSCSKFLFQTKNPDRLLNFIDLETMINWVFCTTIETNRYDKNIMGNSPHPINRANAMNTISLLGLKTYVTIEPIMDFDLYEMVELIRKFNPLQVNIGADSKGHCLPEPSEIKLEDLIDLLNFTKVKLKDNLRRLMK